MVKIEDFEDYIRFIVPNDGNLADLIIDTLVKYTTKEHPLLGKYNFYSDEFKQVRKDFKEYGQSGLTGFNKEGITGYLDSTEKGDILLGIKRDSQTDKKKFKEYLEEIIDEKYPGSYVMPPIKITINLKCKGYSAVIKELNNILNSDIPYTKKDLDKVFNEDPFYKPLHKEDLEISLLYIDMLKEEQPVSITIAPNYKSKNLIKQLNILEDIKSELAGAAGI